MKEAPEKIYLTKNLLGELYDDWDALPSEVFTNIEYTRTDAFIEKACDAYCRLCDTKECGDTGECEWVEKFRKRLMR